MIQGCGKKYTFHNIFKVGVKTNACLDLNRNLIVDLGTIYAYSSTGPSPCINAWTTANLIMTLKKLSKFPPKTDNKCKK